MRKYTRQAIFNTSPQATNNDKEDRYNHRKHFIQQPRLETTNMQDESYSTQLKKTRGMSKDIATIIGNTVFKGPGTSGGEDTHKKSNETQSQMHRGRTRHSTPTFGSLYSNDGTAKQGRTTRHSPTGIGNNFSEGVC